MRRGTLQVWTLGIWFAGLILLEGLVLTAHLRDVDAFKITRGTVVEFREECRRRSSDPKFLKHAEGAAQALDAKVGSPLRVRTPKEMATYLREQIPWLDDKLVDFVTRAAKGGEVEQYYLRILSLYLPWLSIMLAGLFTDSTLDRQVRNDKAHVSLALSGLLQIVYLVTLTFSLFVGQIDATVNVQPVTVTVASFVGVLVQFIFPTSQAAP